MLLGKPFLLFLTNESTMADSLSSAASVSLWGMKTLSIVLLSSPRSKDCDGLGAACRHSVQLWLTALAFPSFLCFRLQTDDLCVYDGEARAVSRGGKGRQMLGVDTLFQEWPHKNVYSFSPRPPPHLSLYLFLPPLTPPLLPLADIDLGGAAAAP